MSEAGPRFYLISPPVPELGGFSSLLQHLLDAVDIAAVRLSLALENADDILRLCDHVRTITEPRDIALVISDHFRLVEKAGLDGVHLSDGARNVSAARKLLGDDAVVGAFCGNSKHDGLIAGEAGADYVSFGPIQDDGLGKGLIAEKELFEFWAEMIEIPVVAEGGLYEPALQEMAALPDFFGLGPEIWNHEHPERQIKHLSSIIQAAASSGS